jgi:hypothetical protein
VTTDSVRTPTVAPCETRDAAKEWRYKNLVEMVVKVDDNFVPMLVTPVMMRSAIKDAIRAYSIAVAPDLFMMNLHKSFMAIVPASMPPK